MSTPILVNLPEDALRRAQRLADLTGRDIANVLADTLDLSLPDLPVDIGQSFFNDSLADDQVLALAVAEMPVEEDARLSALLECQQADELSTTEQHELIRLMQLYQEQLLLKAEALALAVKRGLLPPLAS